MVKNSWPEAVGIGLAIVIGSSITIGMGYVLAHFIIKFW